MHAKSGGSCGEPPDFLFIPAACRSRKDLPRSAGGGDRARNAGYRLRNAEDGGTGTGRRRRGCGATGTERRAAGPRVRVRVRDAEHGTRNTEHGTRKTRARDAKRGTRKTWTRARARGAGDGRRGTGDGAQAPVHGTQRDRIRPARPRNNRPGPFTAGRHPPPGPIRRDLSRLDARRRDPQQPAGAIHSRAPSAAGTNPPGPFTAGRPPPGPATTRRGHSQPGAIRHRDLQQPAGAVHSRAPSAAGRRYLSRVRIRITPLPPRTPYMLLPRCTSTDLTS